MYSPVVENRHRAKGRRASGAPVDALVADESRFVFVSTVMDNKAKKTRVQARF